MAARSPAFDLVIIADWSAAQGRRPEPCEDRCWLAWGLADESPEARSEPIYCPTRLEAEDRIRELLESHAGARTLLGIDVAIGYPLSDAGEPVLPTGRELIARLAPHITDDRSGNNNRFEVAATLNREIRSVTGAAHGPFWGRPKDLDLPDLPMTRPEGTGVRKLRACDVAARRQTKTKPKSPWQLAGAGSVGSQSLMAAPMIHRLLTDAALGGRGHLWPYEAVAPDRPAGAFTIAEIYPSMFEPLAPKYWYKDARQVCDTRDALLDRGVSAEVAGIPQPPYADGWILGIGVSESAATPPDRSAKPSGG